MANLIGTTWKLTLNAWMSDNDSTWNIETTAGNNFTCATSQEQTFVAYTRTIKFYLGSTQIGSKTNSEQYYWPSYPDAAQISNALEFTITGGTHATSDAFLTWLQAHATQIIPESELRLNGAVTDEYDGHKIRYIYYNNNTYKVASVYSITNSITNGTATGSTAISSVGTATVTVSANSGYTLPSSITVSGASYTYDSTTGVIALSNATGNVSITVVCESASNYSYSQNGSELTITNGIYVKYDNELHIGDNPPYRVRFSYNSIHNADAYMRVNGGSSTVVTHNSIVNNVRSLVLSSPDSYNKFDISIGTTSGAGDLGVIEGSYDQSYDVTEYLQKNRNADCYIRLYCMR